MQTPSEIFTTWERFKMAEVPDHLVPQDGLTNSAIRFDALEILHGEHKTRFSFGIYDEQQVWVADFKIDIPTGAADGVAAMIAEAHRRMTDVLRQWLYMTDVMRGSYETQPSDPSEETASQ
jgi:hypothetical protein